MRSEKNEKKCPICGNWVEIDILVDFIISVLPVHICVNGNLSNSPACDINCLG